MAASRAGTLSKPVERPSDTFARGRVNDEKFLGEDASDENVTRLSFGGSYGVLPSQQCGVMGARR